MASLQLLLTIHQVVDTVDDDLNKFHLDGEKEAGAQGGGVVEKGEGEMINSSRRCLQSPQNVNLPLSRTLSHETQALVGGVSP